ncbi:GGDEF domain-containing protein [Halopseudomonas salegens]|uniref:diguanylate cyclase n=1 Tax=Halopseudomonas salegens TaxID=1434072 RepID=A0A1H2G5X8_9GAMM|nr:GGDEF domain-containing protein [Halopseudomonas salegens]SDU14997.1 diguanylate cyclase [Halopseudomonas salegens]
MNSTSGNTIDFDSARLKIKSAGAQASKSVHSSASPSVSQLQQSLSQLLQTSLEMDRILGLFFATLQQALELNSLEYRHDAKQLQFDFGSPALHRCSYRLTHLGDFLGELRFSRSKRFSEAQLKGLESLLGSLLYPLRNALLYHEAIACALNDPLTGCGNRLALDQALDREIKHAIRKRTDLSMMVIDIDHFKTINDTYGHAFGDEALKAMVSACEGCLRAVDGLFRLGGEEFVVLLSDTSLVDARMVAERIRNAIAEMQFQLDGQPIPLTVSIGVARRRNDESQQALYERCDQQMYKAKRGGRNQVIAEG